MGVEVFHHLKAHPQEEGPWPPPWATRAASRPTCKSSEEALETILDAIKAAGYKAGAQISLALDVAASEFHEGKKYVFKKSGGAVKTSEQMVAMYEKWVKAYPIVSIEDGVGEKDWPGWKALTEALGDSVQLVGDDLFVTNPEILARGIAEGIANSVLVKVNQIGTLTETLDCVALAVARRLHLHDEPPQRRDRGRDHRRPRGGHQLRPDQDRLRLAHRPRGEVQPAAAHRGGAGPDGAVRGPGRAQPAGAVRSRSYSSSSTLILSDRRNFLSSGVILSVGGLALVDLEVEGGDLATRGCRSC